MVGNRQTPIFFETDKVEAFVKHTFPNSIGTK